MEDQQRRAIIASCVRIYEHHAHRKANAATPSCPPELELACVCVGQQLMLSLHG